MSRVERFKRSQPSNTKIIEPEPSKPELIPLKGGEIPRPVSGDAAALVSRPDDFQVYILHALLSVTLFELNFCYILNVKNLFLGKY